MSVFQDNPKDVFPFEVSGCDRFRTGEKCELDTGLWILQRPKGTVGVTTTETSVTFTVIENGYFDAPGSTIEFSTYERDGGVYLQQDAKAHGAEAYVALALNETPFYESRSAGVWGKQAQNLATVLARSGNPR
jgi:hypothetical protein